MSAWLVEIRHPSQDALTASAVIIMVAASYDNQLVFPDTIHKPVFSCDSSAVHPFGFPFQNLWLPSSG